MFFFFLFVIEISVKVNIKLFVIIFYNSVMRNQSKKSEKHPKSCYMNSQTDCLLCFV